MESKQSSSKASRIHRRKIAPFKCKKLQLYIGLYNINGALGQNLPTRPQGYCWTFLVAPEAATKDQECISYRPMIDEVWHPLKYPEVEIRQRWKTGRFVVPSVRHEDIVARVLIAEVDSVEAVEGNIQNAWPEKEMHVTDCGKNQTSRDWVQRTVEGWGGCGPGGCGPDPMLKSRSMLSSKLADWEKIETCCTNFALKAAAESASASTDTIPTFEC